MRTKTENIGSGDQSWLASVHGTHNARTGTLKTSAFTKAAHYPDGFFPSGLIVNCADEGAVGPFTGAEGEVFGVLLTGQSSDGVADIPAPILRHGTVKTKRLPVQTNLPTTAPNGFVFITETNA